MIKVGITGRTGSGKSTISNMLKDKGAVVLDVDLVAREIVIPGSKGLKDIIEAFGEEILNPDGTLNRKKLGSIVFNSEEKLELLNSLTHPELFSRTKAWLDQMEKENHVAAVIDAAILIESGMDKLADIVIFACAEEEISIERIMKRDNLPYKQAKSRLKSQRPEEFYLSHADICIDSTLGVEDKIDDLWAQVLSFDKS